MVVHPHLLAVTVRPRDQRLIGSASGNPASIAREQLGPKLSSAPWPDSRRRLSSSQSSEGVKCRRISVDDRLMSLFRKKNRDEKPVDMNARSPQLGVKYKDLMVLDQLAKAGADLSASRHVVYYSYAPTELVAQAMAHEAEAQHFTAVIREPPPEHPDQWSLVCDMHAVASADFVRESDDFFQDLADRHGALYDGWEAAA